jgi:hypothetical protein
VAAAKVTCEHGEQYDQSVVFHPHELETLGLGLWPIWATITNPAHWASKNVHRFHYVLAHFYLLPLGYLLPSPRCLNLSDPFPQDHPRSYPDN